MDLQDLALFRFAFELAGEEDCIHTNVLHPHVYQRLSKGGYSIARNQKDLDRIKSFLKRFSLQLFNQSQPYIPDFHDETSKEDMLLNQQYMKIYYSPTEGHACDKLVDFYAYAVSKQLDFKEVLKKCMANTGLKLQTYHLSNSLYRGYQDLVIDALYAGVVDTKTTQFYMAAPNQQATLRFYAERYGLERIITALDAIEN